MLSPVLGGEHATGDYWGVAIFFAMKSEQIGARTVSGEHSCEHIHTMLHGAQGIFRRAKRFLVFRLAIQQSIFARRSISLQTIARRQLAKRPPLRFIKISASLVS